MSLKTLNWKYIRLAFVATGIISGSQLHNQEAGFPAPWIVSLFILIVGPLMMLVVLAMNSKRLPQFWNPPCWEINPLSLNEPFQFFHTIAWQILVSGVVGFVLLPWVGFSSAGQAMLPIAFGFSLLLGLYLGMKAFHDRFEEKHISAKVAFFGYWQKPKKTK
jgi:hypothetical protein